MSYINLTYFFCKDGKFQRRKDKTKIIKSIIFKYINVGFVDYRLFSSVREGGHFDTQRSSLWEKYVQKLIEGKLNSGEVADEVREIPPDILATLINNKIKDMKEETYDRVITAYLRSSTENTFSEHDLKKVLKFIDSLAPELKKTISILDVENPDKRDRYNLKGVNTFFFRGNVKFNLYYQRI